MFIIFEDVVLNCDNIVHFYKQDDSLDYSKPYCIKFDGMDAHCYEIEFKEKKNRDENFQYILDCLEQGKKSAYLY